MGCGVSTGNAKASCARHFLFAFLSLVVVSGGAAGNSSLVSPGPPTRMRTQNATWSSDGAFAGEDDRPTHGWAEDAAPWRPVAYGKGDPLSLSFSLPLFPPPVPAGLRFPFLGSPWRRRLQRVNSGVQSGGRVRSRWTPTSTGGCLTNAIAMSATPFFAQTAVRRQSSAEQAARTFLPLSEMGEQWREIRMRAAACRGYLHFSPSGFLLLLLLLCMSALATSSPGLHGGAVCNGSIAECRVEEELLMDSDIHGRMLEVGRRYISNAVLDRNRPVCNSGRGNSYLGSNGCVPRQPNTSRRPCLPYQRCRSR